MTATRMFFKEQVIDSVTGLQWPPGADDTVVDTDLQGRLRAKTGAHGERSVVDLGGNLLSFPGAPGADRVAIWDHSAAALQWATLSGGLSISGTTLSWTAPSDVLLESELADPAAVKGVDQALTTSSEVTHARQTLTASSSTFLLEANQNNASFAAYVSAIRCARPGHTAYHFLGFISDIAGSPDIETRFRGDGAVFSDGPYSGSGADYAEYFEWDDGNPNDEDRRGYPVTLAAGGKIRIATGADDPAAIIGVISGNPTVTGDSAANKWTGKYLRDDFGAYLMEAYSAIEWTETPEDGAPEVRAYAVDRVPPGVTPPPDAMTRTTDDAGAPLMRRLLNPDFDPGAPYTPREARPEWDAVGLMGKLRLRKGQPVGDRWIKMRDVSATVEEWLVR